ncbi:MAG: cytochrome c3 family protein [Acidobacteria bacterium]|nr:cytochrome c3 family protein [Acidobacteriota bacterium]
MQRAKLWLLILFGIACLSFPVAATQKKVNKSRLTAYRDNSCVACHSTLLEPLRVSAHFYEWLNSAHQEKGVGCEKCHGGNPSAKIQKTAHTGMLRAAFPQSRLNPKNLPATCGSCHVEVVNAFLGSKHYKMFQESGTGPSCTTCHHHMATSVITWPPETTALCANCHNNSGGPAAQYLEVPEKAGDVIAAFSRADEVIDWSYFLIAEERKRVRGFKAEEEQLKRLAAILKGAKLNWHEFDLSKSRGQADQVFFEATKVMNKLWRKSP